MMDFEPSSKRPRISLKLRETDPLEVVKHNDATKETECVQGEMGEISGEGWNASESSVCKPAILNASVSEKDVGIVEFVSNLPGFHGVLKQRFTDFVVNERDLQGSLARLTDVSVPLREKSEEFHLDILSAEDKEKIQEVIDDEQRKKSAILSPDDDKQHRRLVHRVIRENFSLLGKPVFD